MDGYTVFHGGCAVFWGGCAVFQGGCAVFCCGTALTYKLCILLLLDYFHPINDGFVYNYPSLSMCKLCIPLTEHVQSLYWACAEIIYIIYPVCDGKITLTKTHTQTQTRWFYTLVYSLDFMLWLEALILSRGRSGIPVRSAPTLEGCQPYILPSWPKIPTRSRRKGGWVISLKRPLLSFKFFSQNTSSN